MTTSAKRLTFVVASVLFFMGVESLSPMTVTPGLTHNIDLDEDGEYYLHWKFDNSSITCEVHCKTLGWAGIGFSANGRMKGADLVMMWIDSSGSPQLRDMHGVGDRTPVLDPNKGGATYELLDGRREGDWIAVTFKRSRRPCDDDDFAIEEGMTVRVMFASSDENPDIETEVRSAKKHLKRGVKSSILVGEPEMKITPPKHERRIHLDFRSNVTLPAKSTYYHCRMFPLPHLNDTPHHIIRTEAIITPGNEGVVHHFVVYECDDSYKPGSKWNESHPGGECDDPNMPVDFESCRRNLISAWAIGQGPNDYPAVAGYPTKRGYMVVETHYDNPELKEDIHDESGMRIILTPDLRKYEAGILMVGVPLTNFFPMLIPPRVDDFRVDSYCSKSCTKYRIPKEGVHVFEVFLHAHLAGTKMVVRHIRDGVELEPMGKDDYYDFDYQQSRRFSRERLLLPGDELISTCHYSTRDRSRPTWGGNGTREEMCLHFFSYYPKMDLSMCTSSTTNLLDHGSWVNYWAMQGRIKPEGLRAAEKLKGNHWRTQIDRLITLADNLEWNDEMVEDLQRFVDSDRGQHEMCGGLETRNKIVVEKPLPPPQCKN